jgi:hypothetical protein
MKLDHEQLQRTASELGTRAEPLERVLRLIDLLDAIRMHPLLGDRLVLKGGTALNVFLFDLPRLSVDIDLNYIGASDRETMLTERPEVEESLGAVCRSRGIRVRRSPTNHAGGKWRLAFDRAAGGTGMLELDVNFLLRVPLWPPVRRDSPRVLGVQAHDVPLLDLHELAAGKLAALFGRTASRDLFDAARLLAMKDLDPTKLRIAFVAYGAMSRVDWRTLAIDDITLNTDDAVHRLLPLLRGEHVPGRQTIESWCRDLVERTRSGLSLVLPLTTDEMGFLDRLNGEGDVRPELLTDDAELRWRIGIHPAIQWKSLNVRQHRNRSRS